MTNMAIVRRTSMLKSEPNINNARQPDTSLGQYTRSSSASVEIATQRRRRWLLCRPRPIFWRELPRKLLDRLKSHIKQRHPVHVAIFGFLLLILLNHYVILLVGPRGSIKGGHLGNMWDQFVRDYTRYETMSRWREEVRSELRIPIAYKEMEGALLEPRFYPLDVIIKTRPNSAVVEMLLREKRRVRMFDALIRGANSTAEKCSRDQNLSVAIPTTVLQLLPRHEQPALPPYWIARSDLIDLDLIAIHNSDVNMFSSQLVTSCRDTARSNHKFLDLHCLAYNIGGMQLSDSVVLHESRPQIDSIFSMMGPSKTDPPQDTLGGGNCNSRIGYAIFSNIPTPDDQLKKTSAISSQVSTIFAAFPPNHLGYLCLPPFDHSVGISPYNEANKELSFQSTFANKLLTEIGSKDFKSTSSVWGLATLTCDFDDGSDDVMSNCCDRVSVSLLDSIDGGDISQYLKNEQVRQKDNDEQRHYLIFTSSKSIPTKDEIGASNQSNMVSVKIKEPTNNKKSSQQHKQSIQMELRNINRCEPGWFCNRCLQSSRYGSFSKCASSCGECAVGAICSGENTKSSQVKIDVEVTGLTHPRTTSGGNVWYAARQNRIPRIIHQTYFEEISMEKYPQLLRLQNTWKASGWQYKFYTDDTARHYIETNYPPRFVSVFDALLPGAYKADFFRYLVLFQEGGIYVDVDVMLNTNLDTFLTPDLSFFAPLDAVGSYADEKFCLWNGLLGSAPAHPALANVVEWMVNLVSNRADMYDMERTVCQISGADQIENWKVRTEPGLMLSGPCALGLAVNNAVGNEPLRGFNPGLMTREGYNRKKIEGLDSDAIGNVMILSVDKNDLGAFRFNDPERNVMIASTDLPGLSKAPLVYEISSQNLRIRNILQKSKPHYSISTSGQQLWGTHDVYADDVVKNDVVSFVVSYKL